MLIHVFLSVIILIGDNMGILEIFFILVVFICSIGIIGLVYYNKFGELIIYINEGEQNIDESLRRKFDLLNRLINVINGNVENVNDKFEDFIKLRGKKLTNFDMDRKLVACSTIFYEIGEIHKELKNIKNYNKMLKELEENEEKLIAAKSYYNNIINNYNRLVRLFPSNIIAILNHYKEKPFFDGKNMYDEVYNDFQV